MTFFLTSLYITAISSPWLVVEKRHDTEFHFLQLQRSSLPTGVVLLSQYCNCHNWSSFRITRSFCNITLIEALLEMLYKGMSHIQLVRSLEKHLVWILTPLGVHFGTHYVVQTNPLKTFLFRYLSCTNLKASISLSTFWASPWTLICAWNFLKASSMSIPEKSISSTTQLRKHTHTHTHTA